jgi:hypothetical protein
VPVASDPQKLQINPSQGPDLCLVLLRKSPDLFFGTDRSIRNVDLVFARVDILEEILFHESVVALEIFSGDAIVFILVEEDAFRKVHFTCAVHSHELAIYAERRTTRC